MIGRRRTGTTLGVGESRAGTSPSASGRGSSDGLRSSPSGWTLLTSFKSEQDAQHRVPQAFFDPTLDATAT